jgi:hypothetical protein
MSWIYIRSWGKIIERKLLQTRHVLIFGEGQHHVGEPISQTSTFSRNESPPSITNNVGNQRMQNEDVTRSLQRESGAQRIIEYTNSPSPVRLGGRVQVLRF